MDDEVEADRVAVDKDYDVDDVVAIYVDHCRCMTSMIESMTAPRIRHDVELASGASWMTRARRTVSRLIKIMM